MTVWKPIKGFDDLYEISDTGEIRNILTGKRRNAQLHPSGYLSISLYHNGRSTFKLIHRMMAESFISNVGNKREVNHKDGNKLNNAISNLEWSTTSENTTHAYKSGLAKSGEMHSNSILSNADTEFIRTHYKARDNTYGGKQLAERFGISKQLVSAIVTGVARKWV